MRTVWNAVAAGCTLLVIAATASAGAPPKHWDVLDKYCSECHNTTDWAGGVAFDALDPDSIAKEAATWEKTVRKLQTGMMPPGGKPRPSRAVLDEFAGALAVKLDQAGKDRPTPGTKSLHRLNRSEYANAVRDILNLRVDVTTLLPADDSAEGFDNIADVLGVSPTLIQSYVSAAMKISRSAVGDRSMQPSLVKYAAPAGLSQQDHIEGMPLGTRGGIRFTHNFPLDAEYEFRIAAGGGFRFTGTTGGPEPRLDVTLNGAPVAASDPRKFRVRIPAGPQTLTIALVEQRRWMGVDEFYSQSIARGADFESVTIDGPFNSTGAGDTPSRRAIFTCQPKDVAAEPACARQILAHLATLAFRRPVLVSDPDLQPMIEFYEAGRKQHDFETGIQRGVARLLTDPKFMYRIEADRADLPDGAVFPISDLELAARLSFFLWSSVPDAELLKVAAAGRLHQPKVLEQQLRRMLADTRASQLVDNFGGQWLHLRELRNAQPADRSFDENLRVAFEQETQLLFSTVLREDRSILELIDADFTFLNERLARHYGVAGIRGSYMRRVALPQDSPRRGLLGQGSVLTVTSVGDRTSPVVRGSWVLENLLGAPAPRPPPGVEADLKIAEHAPSTIRARLEQHRANASCAMCHQIMDPIGFALENFDLIGRWRTQDGVGPVDAEGKLVDGTPLHGPQSLRAALLSRREAFVTAFTEKLLTYALGRRIEYYDQPAIREIVRRADRDGDRFTAILLGIVNSQPFQFKTKVTSSAQPTTTAQR